MYVVTRLPASFPIKRNSDPHGPDDGTNHKPLKFVFRSFKLVRYNARMNSIIPKDLPLYKQLDQLAQRQRIILFAGLPGMGKSLLLQQTSLMAHGHGRQIHQLQWDVTRMAFETDSVIARYPEVDGVTHAVIRKAVGLWARWGVEEWHLGNPSSDHILIGEVPLVGNRLVELVQKHDDGVEALLASPQTTFAIPVPSVEIRNLIEAARAKSIADPQHEREAKDAPPHVLRDHWLELFQVGKQIGLIEPSIVEPLYDPHVYSSTYSSLLIHRHTTTVPLNQRLDTTNHSVYNVNFVPHELVAERDIAEAFVAQVEHKYSDLAQLQSEIDLWYDVSV